MKHLLLVVLSPLIILASCKKSTTTANSASLNIVQATLDVPAVYAYFTNTPSAFYMQQTPLIIASAEEISATPGVNDLSILSTTDTTHPLFQGLFTLQRGNIYSLYLAGSSTRIDTLFMQDHIPSYTDSTVGLRFVNLSPGSSAFSVNLVGNPPSQTEFANLGYKQISTFKSYPANSSIGGSYNFEIRSQENDSLLTTYTWSYTLKRCHTIVISGTLDNSLTIFQVNNY